jgi:hypothetical protein
MSAAGEKTNKEHLGVFKTAPCEPSGPRANPLELRAGWRNITDEDEAWTYWRETTCT